MEIRCEQVSKVLKGNTVLNQIEMTFKGGQIYGLRGYNGSGKTMLLRMVCGLIRPTTGRVLIDDAELGKAMDYPPSVGMLIENPAFLGEFSGEKNLEMIMSLKGCCDHGRIRECLKIVGLADNGKVRYKKYSLGMKQRLGIAAAIMEQPSLILLDEPTNALDAAGIEMVKEVIMSLKSEDRLIIIASHEKEFLEALSDVIYEMDGGRIRQAGEV